jgi:hypothetical protein
MHPSPRYFLERLYHLSANDRVILVAGFLKILMSLLTDCGKELRPYVDGTTVRAIDKWDKARWHAPVISRPEARAHLFCSYDIAMQQ